MKIVLPKRGFISNRWAIRWEESLITGNGAIGALVPGRPYFETITFSHEQLFAPHTPPLPNAHLAPHLEKIRSLINEGKYLEASKLATS